MAYIPETESGNKVSTLNSSTSPLVSAAVFTGSWEDVSQYNSVVVAVNTDQDGTFSIQFSPDGINIDSSLTRYYRADQIEAPHRFTITRRYFRIIFTNNNPSLSNQNHLRLQTTFGDKGDLNAPNDSVVPQDFDSTCTRPTNFDNEVPLGLRQGYRSWNKFGYNSDIDVGTEVIASQGGTFTPLYSAVTIDVSSASANDTLLGTGARTVLIDGVGPDYVYQTESLDMNGVTPVTTSNTWIGVNRVQITESGSLKTNDGTITIAATAGATQAQIPAGGGTTQALIYHSPSDRKALIKRMSVNMIKISGGGGSPVATIKGWVYSSVTNSTKEIFRVSMDSSVSNYIEVDFSSPNLIDEKSTFWLEGTTDVNNTVISARVDIVEARTPSGY